MKRKVAAGIAALTLAAAGASFAGPREELLAGYGAGGFSAARGEAFHRKDFAGGKPDTPSCVSCHGEDARKAGRTLTGKTIEPLAVSVTPSRFTDAAKVEKWFKRNCKEVLGRECTPAEKGDWLAYMMSR